MEITGKITQILPLENGTSNAGKEWKKGTVIIEYSDGRYSNSLALQLRDRAADEYFAHLKNGQTLKFHFDAKSREFNGRWYTDCYVWRVESLKDAPQPSAPIPQPAAPQPAAPAAQTFSASDFDQLPF